MIAYSGVFEELRAFDEIAENMGDDYMALLNLGGDGGRAGQQIVACGPRREACLAAETDRTNADGSC